MGRLNKIILIGHVGQDAEVRYTPNGDSVASFSLAVSNRYTNREGQQIDDTEWFRINAWGSRAEFVGNYIKKGMNIYLGLVICSTIMMLIGRTLDGWLLEEGMVLYQAV